SFFFVFLNLSVVRSSISAPWQRSSLGALQKRFQARLVVPSQPAHLRSWTRNQVSGNAESHSSIRSSTFFHRQRP
ncbi:hypothetical protein C8F04DRAFT_1156464, partial [Mycena alexandri]